MTSHFPRPVPGVMTAAVLALIANTAAAFNLQTDNPDLQMRWDTTLKYSAAWRLQDADARLLVSPNHDDGDRNFGRGLISSRADLFSEFDAVFRGNTGLRVSAAGWYDSVYNRRNDNPGFAGGAFPNQIGPANEFPSETRTQHGREMELLDAFVFGKTDLGDGHTLTGRLGQHSLLWGESLFLGANAIAGGQQPFDAVKLMSVPGTQFKEAVRPVPQVSGQLQLASNLSIGAYYQFRWEPTVAPAVGSYFSDVDLAIRGAERMLLAPPMSAPRGPDVEPGNSGQGGLQVRWRLGETDLGLYAVRFNAKTPQVVPTLGMVAQSPVPVVAPIGYRQVYHEGIQAFGLSASHTFGDVNLAGEASIRHNQDLASTRGADASAIGGPGLSAGYATGDTAHLNVSMISTLPSTPLWREATFMGEVAWNRVLSVRSNPEAIDPNATRDATALRFVFEPTYRQVLPGLDLGVPIGLGWAPKGSRSMALGPVPMPSNGNGDFSIGLSGSYLDVWRFSVTWTTYLGDAGTFQNGANFTDYSYLQSLKDRRFLSLAIYRTF
ncbi:DUF1302 domain-containing protein [Variovorax sp. Sphag1AA]|uniref:DUF1302 domain-containing protein n=1 Tax=Variovorax sp. Sphag1AA TaxID=2587027 RepID=UPI0017BBEA02|nr:DUF1302 domain-containing protein [Variovorax sp. Sphag1AA]MBB3177997.1 hypothetical protein [Variovorax sp. Sphag1AA]